VADVEPMLREMVASATKDLPTAVTAAARSAVQELPPAKPEEVDRDELRRMVADEVATLPAPEPGKDADPLVIRQMVQEEVAKLPEPEPGKSVDPAEVRAMVEETVTRAIAALPEPRPGKDVDPKEVAALVEAAASRILAGWERPTDGKSVTVEQVAPMLAELVSKAVADIPRPKDGVGLAGALIDRDGGLILTLSNGETVTLGRVVGRDVDAVDVERRLKEMFDAWPKPEQGKDGLGFDDMDMVETPEGMVLRFARGTEVKDFLVPVVLDRGVWKLGDAYHRGAGVTFDGSFWISQNDGNADKPGTSKAWRLAVRKGKDRTDPVKIGE
jgi:hypothetical protein